MATVLMTWELGSGLGHMTSMKPIAVGLLKSGHRVIVALRDFANASKVFEDTDVEYLAAPTRSNRVSEAFPMASSFAEILHNIGFGDVSSLQTQVGAWRTLYELLQPDLIIADHSPVALLAARGFAAKVVTMGTGFDCPAAGQSFPNWRPEKNRTQQQLLDVEQQVLKNSNAVLRTFGPQLDFLPDLYREVQHTVLLTYKELDLFDERHETKYRGIWPNKLGAPPKWPTGNGVRIFAYLRTFRGLERLLTVLQSLAASVIIRIPGVDPKLCEKFNGQNFLWAQQFLDIESTLTECDLGIGHGTHVMSAEMLLAGTPLLMLPPYLEQCLNANNVVQMGAGISLNMRVASEATYRNHIDGLLSDQKYKASADGFASKYAAINRQHQLDETIAVLDDMISSKHSP